MNDRDSMILAALLHDVGKLGQWGQHDSDAHPAPPPDLEIAPPQDAHQHVLWTAEFIRNRVTSWPTSVDPRRVAELAAHHHYPEGSDSVQVLIAVANRLSGGGNAIEGDNQTAPGASKPPRLSSAFSHVWAHRQTGTGKSVHHISELSRDDLGVAFPIPETEVESSECSELARSYRELWDQLTEAANATRSQTAEAMIAHLLGLLETYGWFVPHASQHGTNDLSLYDHSRMTAAVAAALFDYHEASDAMTPEAIRDQAKPKFILFAGDLSGIQSYIFQLAEIGTGATAKRLRARSFFAQCLTEAASHKALRTFGLPPCNVIMRSGGRFYALLPNIPDATDKLTSLEQEFDTWCHSELMGQIAVNLAWSQFKPEELAGFSDVLQRLHENLSFSKHRPFSKLLIDDDDTWQESAFIALEECAHEEGICNVCGTIPAEPDEAATAGPERCCRRCRDDRIMGQQLPGTRYVAFYDDPDAGAFPVLGHSFDLCDDDRIDGCPYLVLALGTDDIGPVSRFPLAHRFLAQHVPVADQQTCAHCPGEGKCPIPGAERPQPGHPIFFQCIAERSRGRTSLGYLKGDVDHLGKTFSFGLPEKQRSMSRLMAISRNLDLFFSGYIEQLLRTEFPFVYTVFSGGDDFLLVGPWDAIVDLAERIQADFDRFSCGRLTLSAGIGLSRPRTPVATAVYSADNALEESKETAAPGADESRNQLTAFSTTMKWNTARNSIQEARQLAEWLADGAVNPSACYRLMTYSDLYRRFRNTGQTRHLRFLPLLAYDLARNWPGLNARNPDQRDARAWAEGLKKDAMASGRADTESGAWPPLRFLLEYALNTRRK